MERDVIKVTAIPIDEENTSFSVETDAKDSVELTMAYWCLLKVIARDPECSQLLLVALEILTKHAEDEVFEEIIDMKADASMS